MKQKHLLKNVLDRGHSGFARVLTMLALLITAATGAWAEDLYEEFTTNTGASVYTGEHFKITPEYLGDGDGFTLNTGYYATIEALNGETITKVELTKGFYDINNLHSEVGTVTFSGDVATVSDVNNTSLTFNSNPALQIKAVKVYYTAADAPAVPKHLITATHDEQTRSLEQPLPYATTIGELYEAVTGKSFSDLISTMSLLDMPLNGISSTKTDVVSIGELNSASTPVTVKADGKAAVALRFGNYVQAIFVNVVSPLYAYMKDGVKDADKWTASTDGTNFGALPIGGLKGDGTETVTLQYNGRLKVKGVKATSDAKPVWDGDLSKLTAESTEEFATATDGMIITGTLAANVKVSIANGATVTLDGVTINGVSNFVLEWAGITCLGDATIILSGTNTVKGFVSTYPGIYVPENKTLTIQGSGSLTASSNGNGCGIGIGGGSDINCGNIVIAGGTITANGGYGAAGIGSGYDGSCGYISITGGTVNATGGENAAGIGGGYDGSCGNISITGGTVNATGGQSAAGIGSGKYGSCGTVTITDGVTSVTATKGDDAPYSIGAGNDGSCGTVTIGGTKYWENNAAVGDGATYLAQATIVYPALIVNPAVGQVIGADGKNYADADAAEAAGTTAVAIITYVGSDNGEAAPYNHGLALAMSDAGGGTIDWNPDETDAGHTYKPSSSSFMSEGGLQYNAMHNTDEYPAFKAAIANNGTAAPTGCSAWFLASGYQWTKMFAGDAGALKTLAGLGSGDYWSSSESGTGGAWYFYSDNGYWYDANKDNLFYVRACLAF